MQALCPFPCAMWVSGTRLFAPHAGALSFVLVRHAGAFVTGFHAPRRRSETRPCVPRKRSVSRFCVPQRHSESTSFRSAGHTPKHLGHRLRSSHCSAHVSLYRHQAHAPRALPVYPCIAVPAIHQSTKVIDSSRHTAQPIYRGAGTRPTHPGLFESTLVSLCQLFAKAPRSLTLNDGLPHPVRHPAAVRGRPRTQAPSLPSCRSAGITPRHQGH